MAGRKSDFTLPTLDDLFSTQELRDDAKLSKIRDIPLELIDDFPDHPFKVRDDEDMIQLVESVKERGVITPATVRQKEDGRYELISGHRRKRACELAGFEALRCEVVDLDRDAATVLMVESNYQRSQILPSEKAFAYKMRLEAMKRQAGRPSKDNSVPVAQNYEGKTSRELLGEQVGESQDQVRRYIRLTNLVPELLELVDEGKIKMRPAVELSYLDEDSQRAVVDEIDLNQCTPSHDQTIRITRTVVSTTKEAPIESKPIGRIDYLGTDGKVGESIEYTSPYQFEKDIKEENYYGVPMSIVLYKDKDGSTIPYDFVTRLDPPPKGFEIIDSPYLPENALDKAKHLIDDFCREEYQREDGADYTDLTDVGVAYTTTEDDKHEIQARVNLVDFRIETLADGKVVRSVQYRFSKK